MNWGWGRWQGRLIMHQASEGFASESNPDPAPACTSFILSRGRAGAGVWLHRRPVVFGSTSCCGSSVGRRSVFLQRCLVAKADPVSFMPLLVHHAFRFLQLSARRELKKYFRSLAARSSVLGDLGWFVLSPYLGGRIALVFSFFCCLKFTCSFIFLQFSLPSPALWYIQPLSRTLCCWVLAAHYWETSCSGVWLYFQLGEENLQ